MNKTKIKKQLEEIILSTMIHYPHSISFLSQRIKVEDVSKENQNLFENILQLIDVSDCEMRLLDLSNSENWDFVTLQSLPNDYSLEKIFHNKILERFHDVNFSLKIDSFLKESLDKNKGNVNGLDTVLDLQSDISSLLKTLDSFKEDKPFDEKIETIFSEIESELNSKNITSFTVTNIPSFNNATGGIRPSNLIGIAGSFKSGKTTLALNLMVDFAKQNIACGVFSLELSETELNRKILSMLSGVPYEKLREPKKLIEDEKQKLNKFKNKVKSLPLFSSDKPMSESEIMQKAKYWKEKFNVKIIAVDYIGYIKSRKRFETREREMSYYSEFLKALAKELDICVIALAQLNRTGKLKPSTDNLAESIALARDCDFLFITYNPKELGIKGNNGYEFTESDFIIRLDTTRHTKYKKQFQLRLKDDGNFIEIATEYVNQYQETSEEIF